MCFHASRVQVFHTAIVKKSIFSEVVQISEAPTNKYFLINFVFNGSEKNILETFSIQSPRRYVITKITKTFSGIYFPAIKKCGQILLQQFRMEGEVGVNEIEFRYLKRRASCTIEKRDILIFMRNFVDISFTLFQYENNIVSSFPESRLSVTVLIKTRLFCQSIPNIYY